jgi:membrane-associated protein
VARGCTIQGVEAFLSALDPLLIYAVVALLTFGESAAFLSLVFPGEVGLVAAAAVGTTTGVNPWVLAGVATAGALLGGLFGYAVGRRYGPRVMRWEPIERRFGERIRDLGPMLAGSDAGALVGVARFNQVTRAIVPALAGMAEMGRVRFAVANGVGALIWAGAFTAIGHYAAEFWRSTSGLIHLIGGAVIVLSAVLWLVLRFRARSDQV